MTDTTPAPDIAVPESPASEAPSAAVLAAQRLAIMALVAGSLGIGFSPIFVRLSELPPVATAFWRVAIAVPVLWAWMAAEARGAEARRATISAPMSWGDRGVLILAGLFFAGDLATWHWSLHHTSVANATLFANIAPLFVTLFAWLLFKERFRPLFLAGLAVSMVGVLTLMGRSFSIGGDNLMGDGVGLITAMFYAGYFVTVGRLRRRFPTAVIMTWSGVVTALVLLVMTLVSGEPIWATTLYGWLVLAGLALISHAGGQSLIAHALAHLPVAFSSITVLLQPVLAAILAWLLLAEPLGAIDILGMAIVLVGIAVARRGGR